MGGGDVWVKSADYTLLRWVFLTLELWKKAVREDIFDLKTSVYIYLVLLCAGLSVCNCSILSSLRTMWARRPSTRLLVRAVWSVSTLSWFRERKLSKSLWSDLCLHFLSSCTIQHLSCAFARDRYQTVRTFEMRFIMMLQKLDLRVNFTDLNIKLNKYKHVNIRILYVIWNVTFLLWLPYTARIKLHC